MSQTTIIVLIRSLVFVMTGAALLSGFIHPLLTLACLIAVCPLLLASSAMVLKRRSLALSALLVWLAHQTMSLLNYFVTAKGAGKDAVTFHTRAMEAASMPFGELSWDIGAPFYTSFLSVVYRCFGADLLIGQQMSVIAAVLTTIILAHVSRYLGVLRWAPAIILVWGLLPSGVVHRSVTLRESWEILVFVSTLAAYCRLREQRSMSRVLTLILTGLSAAVWHIALALYSVVLLPFAVYRAIPVSRRLSRRAVPVLAFAAVAVVTIYSSSLITLGDQDLAQKLTAGELDDAAVQHRERVSAEGRATYGVDLDTGSAAALFASVSLAFGFYMIEPLPYNVENLLDLYALAENMFRVALLASTVLALSQWSPERRARVGTIVVLGLVLELIWAAGTINWGTAVRHHLIAWPAFIVCGLPPLAAGIHAGMRWLLCCRIISRSGTVSDGVSRSSRYVRL